MKKIILLTIIFIKFSTNITFAQLEYFHDNFDNYIVNQQLACQNPVDWTTWSYLPCSAEDPNISVNHSLSGTKSVKIFVMNDLIKPLGNITTGRNLINFFIYIPDGKTGYTSILSKFTPEPKEWGLDCYFDLSGIGKLMLVPGEPVFFNYTNNQWHYVRIVVDFNIDEAQFWFNNNLIHLWQWSQNGSISSKLAAHNFYGEFATSEMYIDEYLLGEDCMSCGPPNAPSNLIAQHFFNPEPKVQLNWQDNSGDEKFFKIIRKKGLPNAPSIYEIISLTPSNVTQSIDSTVVTDSTYTYGVIAINMYGYSDTSNFVTITVDPVTTLNEENHFTSYFLDQNYPNPFNPTTNIEFRIADFGFVSLKVYDILGNEIVTLVNEEKPAGEYEVEFSAAELPSGIYFYQLKAGDYVQTKKMVLLR